MALDDLCYSRQNVSRETALNIKEFQLMQQGQKNIIFRRRSFEDYIADNYNS